MEMFIMATETKNSVRPFTPASSIATAEPATPTATSATGEDTAEDLRYLGHVLKEIIATEERFIKDLRVFYDAFKPEYFNKPSPGEKLEIETYLDPIKKILDTHTFPSTSFSAPAGKEAAEAKASALPLTKEQAKTDIENIIAWVEGRKFEVFTTAILQYEHAKNRLLYLFKERSKVFARVTKNLQEKSFSHFLIMPVQRLPRYVLFLNQIEEYLKKIPVISPDQEETRSYVETQYGKIAKIKREVMLIQTAAKLQHDDPKDPTNNNKPANTSPEFIFEAAKLSLINALKSKINEKINSLQENESIKTKVTTAAHYEANARIIRELKTLQETVSQLKNCQHLSEIKKVLNKIQKYTPIYNFLTAHLTALEGRVENLGLSFPTEPATSVLGPTEAKEENTSRASTPETPTSPVSMPTHQRVESAPAVLSSFFAPTAGSAASGEKTDNALPLSAAPGIVRFHKRVASTPAALPSSLTATTGSASESETKGAGSGPIAQPVLKLPPKHPTQPVPSVPATDSAGAASSIPAAASVSTAGASDLPPLTRPRSAGADLPPLPRPRSLGNNVKNLTALFAPKPEDNKSGPQPKRASLRPGSAPAIAGSAGSSVSTPASASTAGPSKT